VISQRDLRQRLHLQKVLRLREPRIRWPFFVPDGTIYAR
jgi:hypothetical protein